MLTNVAKTLYEFFNQFGTSFVSNSVPSGTEYPYITYTLETEGYFNTGIMQVMVYDKNYSFVKVAEIADSIINKIKGGYKLPIKNNDGIIYLENGSPNTQIINDINDITLKTILINIEYRMYE